MNPDAAEKIEAFFTNYPVRHYKNGQILIHAGDDPSSVYHLISGKVKQYDLSYRGDEVVLNVFKPPAFFPMSYAINQTPNDYYYEAEEDIGLNITPIKDVIKFVRSNPDVLYDLLSRVYRGTDGLLRRMAHLMASTAKSRVMYELIIECRRFGKKQDTAIHISLNESDIGSRAGLSRETVSREIQKLKAEGLIAISQRQISIPDLIKLEESLGKDL